MDQVSRLIEDYESRKDNKRAHSWSSVDPIFLGLKFWGKELRPSLLIHQSYRPLWMEKSVFKHKLLLHLLLQRTRSQKTHVVSFLGQLLQNIFVWSVSYDGLHPRVLVKGWEIDNYCRFPIVNWVTTNIDICKYLLIWVNNVFDLVGKDELLS